MQKKRKSEIKKNGDSKWSWSNKANNNTFLASEEGSKETVGGAQGGMWGKNEVSRSPLTFRKSGNNQARPMTFATKRRELQKKKKKGRKWEHWRCTATMKTLALHAACLDHMPTNIGRKMVPNSGNIAHHAYITG